MTGLSDSFQRPINYMRISVTDRCNLRCVYCMPEEGVTPLTHGDILTYEEIRAVAGAAAELGIQKVRITGGEPLVRTGLPRLIRMLAGIEALDDISLTTNGTLLAGFAAELKAAGLRRVNISLDTLRPDRFGQITRGQGLKDVLEGIKAAHTAGLEPVKINMVVMAGVNDDEIVDFGAKTVDEGWHVRFIEFMPLAGDSHSRQYVPTDDVMQRLAVLGELEPFQPTVGNGPAKYYRLPRAKGTVGFITPVSEHFCIRCNRLRLTADGKLRPCLLSADEIDVKQQLRSSNSPAGLKKLIEEAIARKPAQHRLAEGYVPDKRPFSQVGG